MVKRPLYYRRYKLDPFLEKLFLRYKFNHFENITLRHQSQTPASHQLGTVGRYYITIMISRLRVTSVRLHRSPITYHRLDTALNLRNACILCKYKLLECSSLICLQHRQMEEMNSDLPRLL